MKPICPIWIMKRNTNLPIIPAPLAFVSLSFQEQRADLAASVGCAPIVIVVIRAILLLFIFFPL
jgi:hypothetical protein